MRALNLPRWLLVPAIALLLAACSGSRPTRAPTTPPALTPIPVITLAPTATPLVTAPPATCPAGDSTSTATLDIRTTDGIHSIELDEGDLPSIAPVPTDGEPPDPDAAPGPTVLGGTDIVASLTVEAIIDGDVATITALTLDFVPAGASEAEAVEVTIEGDRATLRLPDATATGTLRASAEWTTSCGTGAGAGSMGLAVVESAIAAGCPTTEEGFADQLNELAGKVVTFDTLSVPLGVSGWSARWQPDAAGVDDFPQFSGCDSATSVTVAQGASIVLREAIDDLSLLSLRAAFFERADVEAYLDPDSTSELNSVNIQRRSAGEKGRIGIPVNLDPGSYVMEVQGTSQTSCFDLQTYAVISVEVR
jgi:hypothetical protein